MNKYSGDVIVYSSGFQSLTLRQSLEKGFLCVWHLNVKSNDWAEKTLMHMSSRTKQTCKLENFMHLKHIFSIPSA